jgi:hypothetical protein
MYDPAGRHDRIGYSRRGDETDARTEASPNPTAAANA